MQLSGKVEVWAAVILVVAVIGTVKSELALSWGACSATVGISRRHLDFHDNELFKPVTNERKREVAASAIVECANVTVPLDWENDTKNISTYVQRFRQSTPPPYAIIIIVGGPGETAILPSTSYLYSVFSSFTDTYSLAADIYFINLRGVSHPKVLCSNRLSQNPGLTVLADESGWKECVQELNNTYGSDLQFYTTSAFVSDIHALIESESRLASQQIYLWGISYGTFVANLYLLRYPTGVSGVIYDGLIFGPQADLLGSYDLNHNRVFRELLEACGNNSYCSSKLTTNPFAVMEAAFAKVRDNACSAFPLSERQLKLGIRYALVPKLGAREIIFPLLYRLNRCGEQDGKWLSDVANYLNVDYLNVSATSIPSIINSYNYVLGANILVYVVTERAEGMSCDDFLLHCRLLKVELANLTLSSHSNELANLTRTAAELEEEENATELGVGLWSVKYRLVAEQWPRYDFSYSNQINSATVPALIATGQWDANTPRQIAESVIDQLQHNPKVNIVFPGSAHINLLTNCGYTLVSSFIKSNGTDTATNCVPTTSATSFSGETVKNTLFGYTSGWTNIDIYETDTAAVPLPPTLSGPLPPSSASDLHVPIFFMWTMMLLYLVLCH